MALYQVGLLGAVDAARVARMKLTLRELVTPLGLANEVEVIARFDYHPKKDHSSVALYFGAEGLNPDEAALVRLMREGTPVVPMVPDLKKFSKMIPSCLRAINGLELLQSDKKLVRPANVALEVLGLMPRQRRIFLSYKRLESTQAALQLFEYLSSLKFDVFLDTHGVPPGDDFQEVLWQRLSDSDVLVMLDTDNYFDSRWTKLEFGHALAKSLVPLRLGWPGVKQSPRSYVAESVQLSAADFEAGGKRLRAATLEIAGLAIEKARSRGIALRSSELNDAVIVAVQKIDGRFFALGPKRTIVVELYSKHKVLIYPSIGVPTAEHLHEASLLDADGSRRVVFDDSGVSRRTQGHLDWLDGQVKSARLMRKGNAAWELAALEP
jgi:TIR domain